MERCGRTSSLRNVWRGCTIARRWPLPISGARTPARKLTSQKSEKAACTSVRQSSPTSAQTCQAGPAAPLPCSPALDSPSVAARCGNRRGARAAILRRYSTRVASKLRLVCPPRHISRPSRLAYPKLSSLEHEVHDFLDKVGEVRLLEAEPRSRNPIVFDILEERACDVGGYWPERVRPGWGCESYQNSSSLLRQTS